MPSIDRHPPELLLATTHRGKRDEIAALLQGSGVAARVVTLDEAKPPLPPVDEDGLTFAANATKKARAGALATGWLTLADDSGLEVDALGGRPGVWSARFAGVGASDAENNDALLAALDTSGQRPPFHARFRCVLAVVDPRFSGGAQTRTDRSQAGDPLPAAPSPRAEPRAWLVEGTCEGTIVRPPRGTGGFGYDPLFQLAGTSTTLAELDRAAKNAVSHRGRALAALLPILAPLLAVPR